MNIYLPHVANPQVTQQLFRIISIRRGGLFIIYCDCFIRSNWCNAAWLLRYHCKAAVLILPDIITYIAFEQRPLTNSSDVKSIYSSLNSDSLTDKLLIQSRNMS
ncbi:Hypothetical_protein [Hexamita inflata]|uniref:Hypothetical_protein n=1 Tax=Hexamita inflata TaxID=28002 RepID=A0AA86UXK2_9EUKA|nr:Hypothetical protein HINF_LOCUS63555 [Hexamita inflata]